MLLYTCLSYFSRVSDHVANKCKNNKKTQAATPIAAIPAACLYPQLLSERGRGRKRKRLKGSGKTGKDREQINMERGKEWEDGKVRESKAKGKSEEAEGKKKAEGR